MIELLETTTPEAVIKVVGVGGCGGNAVDHMINNGGRGRRVHHDEHRRPGVEAQPRQDAAATGRRGHQGPWRGCQPEVGRLSAEEDRERITELITGADMLFITAGMGGGTGTGAAPVVAEIARSMGILTVAVVTKPFAFEGKRQKVAAVGIDQLKQHVDSLIIIPNDRLMQVLGEDVTYEDAFPRVE